MWLCLFVFKKRLCKCVVMLEGDIICESVCILFVCIIVIVNAINVIVECVLIGCLLISLA